MVWAGCVLGLLLYQALRWLPVTGPAEPPGIALSPADPWAESKRSRAILEAQEGAPAPISPGRPIAAGAVRVVDGDTFDFAGERIRMVGLDAPETHPPRCAAEAELGARATRRLSQLLAAGPFELMAIDRDRDRYGRKLRIVMRSGRNIGDVLIAEGLARPYEGGLRVGWCG
jgi:micrococcal nuclease